MSWQGYVDEQLVGTGNITAAVIIGAADGSTWATSKNWTLKGGEGAGIVALYKNPADSFAKGITAGGVKYMAIKADDRSIYGKKGATGIVVVKTTQCIIIGYYDETKQPGNAAVVCEKLGDYLIENGY
ncbi:hypothetical protein DICPUDRAFT_91884 [Dictyostelium purpureum]|uniref:Profilin n=1 Tax=Dictyostelium purpureum TaxID=5786 RepID=F0ZIL9_DICPU|nr:uncharacterized protein DICPUDRAFT_91884 [Dictyostelium purpureum]EGC36212.1 hypothetical protein DICPUDRAFT_91884 [Dictyostelium purpureum]|eukprot:XP_003287279.1 hypothetical protein DICPUDRAFT_91884 [Dictyostelium purpureum]